MLSDRLLRVMVKFPFESQWLWKLHGHRWLPTGVRWKGEAAIALGRREDTSLDEAVGMERSDPQ